MAERPAFAVASAGNPASAVASARKPRWTEPLTITGGLQNLWGLYRVWGCSAKGLALNPTASTTAAQFNRTLARGRAFTVVLNASAAPSSASSRHLQHSSPHRMLRKQSHHDANAAMAFRWMAEGLTLLVATNSPRALWDTTSVFLAIVAKKDAADRTLCRRITSELKNTR